MSIWDSLYDNRNVLLGVIVVLVLLTLSCSASTLKSMLGVEGLLVNDSNFLQSGGAGARRHSVRDDQGYMPSTDSMMGAMERPGWQYYSPATAAARAAFQPAAALRRPTWAGAGSHGIDTFSAFPGQTPDSKGLTDDALASTFDH